MEGVVRTENGITFIDLRYYPPEDLIEIVEPYFYMSIHGNDVYKFGYRFKESADSKDISAFIESLEQVGPNPLNDAQLTQFIERPFKCLKTLVSTYQISCLVYPISGRSPLVSKMISSIHDMSSHSLEGAPFELVKSVPENLDFDSKSFEDPEMIEKFSRMQKPEILVIDDINTTGSTLNEILRKLGEINQDSRIYVYTLLGK